MLRTQFLRLGLGTTDGLELYGVSVSIWAPERGKSKSNKISRCPGSRYKWCVIERKIRAEWQSVTNKNAREHNWTHDDTSGTTKQAWREDTTTQVAQPSRSDGRTDPKARRQTNTNRQPNQKIVSECTWVDFATMRKSVVATTLNLINWNRCDMYNSSGMDVLFF